MKTKNANGFTLIEVIVVVVLLSVLALGVFSLFNMYYTTSRETAALMKMQRDADGLRNEWSTMVLTSNLCFPEGEPFQADPSGLTGVTLKDRGVLCYDEMTGDTTGGIRINGEFVEEYVKGTGWTPFRISGGNIGLCKTCPLGADHDNRIIVGDSRQGITIFATLATAINKEHFHLTIERGVFKCRLAEHASPNP